MEDVMNLLAQGSSDPWEDMKPYIEHLWLVEKNKLSDLIQKMKVRHNFHRFDHEYKYRFKKWGWRRSVPKAKMMQAAQQYESRAQAGKSGTVIKYKGQTIEPHKIRRHIKTQTRAEAQAMEFTRAAEPSELTRGPTISFRNSFFLKWNMPYEALSRSHWKPFDYTSPMNYSASTPGSDLAVVTPSSAESPQNARSPTTVVLKKKVALDRAQLFVQGKHDALLSTMNGEEKRIMSDWLYQYWFFCFKTAKHWGRGPSAWTRDLLDFTRFDPHSHRSLPATPHEAPRDTDNPAQDNLAPSHSCRWLIHVQPMQYESIQEEELTFDEADQNVHDETTWVPWPKDQMEPPLQDRLRNALEHNDFSSIPIAILPVAIPQIAKTAKKSADELLVESLGFCIMSRNEYQVSNIINRLVKEKIDFKSLYPLHLATSYLDGHKSCCSIIVSLLADTSGRLMPDLWVNEDGHTVIDNLMITILKCHSKATPGTLDDSMKNVTHYTGEEVDICGRWDADSPCVRHLLATGNPSVPSAWKHKFCHTSIQTIYHSLFIIFRSAPYRLTHETPSGLYVRYCFDCGLKLEMQPLHTLIMTTFNLACYSACEDEDLFGMLACLLCMLSSNFNPRTTANIAVSAFVESEAMQVECAHEELTATEFAEQLSASSNLENWDSKLRLGWGVFCGVLRLCEALNSENDSSEGHDWDSDDDFIGPAELVGSLGENHYENHDQYKSFRTRKDLATLWASVQAEILSYRRVDGHANWTSQYFSMKDLYNQLEAGAPLAVGFATQGLLKPHCVCGMFDCYPFATLSDATNPDIANLDVWGRATYRAVPDDY